MGKELHINVGSLKSLHRFGDMYETALNSIQSELVEIEPFRGAADSIGRHWYGMRLKVRSKKSGQQFYLHTGLIFLPETRIGLMIEVDRKNNLNIYSSVWDGIEDGENFEVNKDEEEYLKLFMPDGDFESLYDMNAQEQLKKIAAYAKEAIEAIAKTEEAEGFRVSYKDLDNAYELALSFEKTLELSEGKEYRVEINPSDPDNFGQYASGYRYWLRSLDGEISMYAYFGAIYSYKKEPSGIFAEIDKFSNRGIYDKVFENMEDDKAYNFSRSEPAFIKLFMPIDTVTKFNASGKKEQETILLEFLNKCNAQLMHAALK